MDFLNNTAMTQSLSQYYKMSDNHIDQVDHQIQMAQSEQITNLYNETR